MRLGKIELKDFLSFEHLEYTFPDYPVLVQGENCTPAQMESQESNGTGKSSLGSGISYAVMQEALRKSDLQDCDLVRWGCDKATINLSIICDVREEILWIHRVIPSKGSTRLELSIEKSGKKEPVKFATVKDGNSFILEWMGGISKEDLKSYFMINKDNYKSFFSSSNTDKIKIISRFSKSDKIDNVFPLLENDIDELNKSLDVPRREIQRLNGQLDVYRENLEEEKNRDLKKERDQKIKDLETKIEEAEKAKEEADANCKDYREKKAAADATIKKNLAEITKVNKDIQIEEKNIDFDDIYTLIDTSVARFEHDKTEKEKEQAQKTKTKKELNEKFAAIEVCLMGTITCPKCGHEWVQENDLGLTLPELVKEGENTGKQIESIQDEIGKIDTYIAGIESQIKEFVEEREVTEKDEKALREKINVLKQAVRTYENTNTDLDTNIKRYERHIATFEKEAATYEENIKTWKDTIIDLKGSVLVNGKILEIEEKIKETEDLIKKKEEEISGLESQLLELNSWKLHFKDFKMELSKESLNVIQLHINKFLETMHSDLRVMVEGYKKLASGEIREEITPYVVRDSVKKFGSFSGGERARMEISMILAIQYMINATNPYGGLQFLHIDEITEGMDPLGVSMMMKSLDGMKFCMLVTTHVTARNLYDKNLVIVKENGVSRLKDGE